MCDVNNRAIDSDRCRLPYRLALERIVKQIQVKINIRLVLRHIVYRLQFRTHHVKYVVIVVP